MGWTSEGLLDTTLLLDLSGKQLTQFFGVVRRKGTGQLGQVYSALLVHTATEAEVLKLSLFAGLRNFESV